MENEFTVSIRTQGRALVLVLAGELDLASFPRLEHALDRALESPPELVVLELGKVEFMDIAGLRAVMRADQLLRGVDRRLAVVDPSPAITRLLELTHQQQRLTVFETLDEALADGPGS